MSTAAKKPRRSGKFQPSYFATDVNKWFWNCQLFLWKGKSVVYIKGAIRWQLEGR